MVFSARMFSLDLQVVSEQVKWIKFWVVTYN